MQIFHAIIIIAFAFVGTSFSVPAGRGFFIPTDLAPEIMADIPPHCLQIDSDMEDCYVNMQTTGDITIDTQKVKECICANDNFSMEKVTSCTQDPYAWADVCGDMLLQQEAALGLEASV